MLVLRILLDGRKEVGNDKKGDLGGGGVGVRTWRPVLVVTPGFSAGSSSSRFLVRPTIWPATIYVTHHHHSTCCELCACCHQDTKKDPAAVGGMLARASAGSPFQTCHDRHKLICALGQTDLRTRLTGVKMQVAKHHPEFTSTFESVCKQDILKG